MAVYRWKPHIPRADPVTIAVRLCCSAFGAAYLRNWLHIGTAVRGVTVNFNEAVKEVLAGIRKAMRKDRVVRRTKEDTQQLRSIKV